MTDAPDHNAVAVPMLKGCKFDFAPGENGRELLVVLSARQVYTMRMGYSRDALYVADQRNGYYFKSPTSVVRRIAAFVDARRYDRVLLIGSSKAGFAALMLGGLLALARPRLAVRVLSLNPLTRMFPDDEAIHYISYRAIQRRALRDARLAGQLRRIGDLSHLAHLGNFHAVITYPEQNPVDVIQARRMTGPNFLLIPVESPIHGTIIFFNWQGASERAILRRLEWLFDKEGADDRDLAATRPADLSAVARAIANTRLPSFHELIDQAIAAEPPVLAGSARLGREARLRATRFRQRARTLAAAFAWGMRDIATSFGVGRGQDKPAIRKPARRKGRPPALDRVKRPPTGGSGEPAAR